MKLAKLKKLTKEYLENSVVTKTGYYLHLGIDGKDIYIQDQQIYDFLFRTELIIEDRWAVDLFKTPQGKSLYLQNNHGWSKEGKSSSNIGKLDIKVEWVDGGKENEENN